MSRQTKNSFDAPYKDPARWARLVNAAFRPLMTIDPETRDRLLDLIDTLFR